MDFLPIVVGALSSLLTSIVWTLVLYRFRPNLSVESIDLESRDKPTQIKVKISNRSNCFAAQNLQVEGAIVDKSAFTYHFAVDREEFLMLAAARSPAGHTRKFGLLGPAEATKQYAKNLAEMLKLLAESGSYLRIRVRGEHEITGFGQVSEYAFRMVGRRFEPLE